LLYLCYNPLTVGTYGTAEIEPLKDHSKMTFKSLFTHPGVVLMPYTLPSFMDYKRRFKKKNVPLTLVM